MRKRREKEKKGGKEEEEGEQRRKGRRKRGIKKNPGVHTCARCVNRHSLLGPEAWALSLPIISSLCSFPSLMLTE